MTIEQLKKLRERVANLNKYLKVEDRKAKFESDRQLTLSPGFWDDNERATAVVKEQNANKFWIDLYERVAGTVDNYATLFDFWKEGEATEEEVKEVYDQAIKRYGRGEFKSTLNQPEDENAGCNGHQLGRGRYRKPGLGRDTGTRCTACTARNKVGT